MAGDFCPEADWYSTSSVFVEPHADATEEFSRLLERRDLTAYRAVAAIELALLFWEAEDYQSAFTRLSQAHEEFQQADARIHAFRKTSQGEQRITNLDFTSNGGAQ
jgi:predicted negative regulator of RcsB-dependent stress response